jgi:hypothetical protein
MSFVGRLKMECWVGGKVLRRELFREGDGMFSIEKSEILERCY